MERIRPSRSAVLVTSDGASDKAQQDYPSRTVTVVNPTQAGATTDVLARALVLGLSSGLGQQFVVVDRYGASGAIRTSPRSRARRRTGYTLLFGAVYVLPCCRQPHSNDIGYEAHALIPVCQTVSNAMVIQVARRFAVQDNGRSGGGRVRSPASSTTATQGSRWNRSPLP